MANTPLKLHLSQNFGNYKWLFHLLFWCMMICFTFIQMRTKGYFTKNLQNPGDIPIFIFTAQAITSIALCYLFRFLVAPLYKGNKYKFWFSLLALVFGIILLQAVAIKMLIDGRPESALAEMSILSLSIKCSSSVVFIFAFFTAFYYFIGIYEQQKEVQQLAQFKTQKIALESSFLKSQINPHFLFNTLNNIYALSLKKSDQTQIVIERLESLLHYMLYECKEELVPLENEFTFTNSYIALEKLRHKEEECEVTINISGDTDDKKIAPLLLINFLENAFKHGTKTSFGKSWINMNVNVTSKSIHFKLQNSKPFRPSGQAIAEYRGGIGLKNVKRRLEILYPGKHKLLINNKKDHFDVDLLINF